MTWIDDAVPDQPTVTKKAGGMLLLENKGTENIKAFAVFILDQGLPVKLVNAQLVQLVVSDKSALLDLSKVPDTEGKRICVAAVDRNNNVSQLLELK